MQSMTRMPHSPVRLVQSMLAIPGINREYIAGQVGVTPAAISHWSSGRHKPTIRHRRRLRDLFRKVNRKQQTASLTERPTDTLAVPVDLPTGHRVIVELAREQIIHYASQALSQALRTS